MSSYLINVPLSLVCLSPVVQLLSLMFHRKVEFVLTEGRNRQIRKMAEAVGLMVVNLHRTSFAGISLTGLKESNWMELSELEMETIQKAILASKAASNSDYDEEED